MSIENHMPDMEDLPNFFSKLSEGDLSFICSSSDKCYRVIAVGREASAGELVLLTGAGDFFTIKPKSLPEGRVFPTRDGKKICFFDAEKEIESYSLITGAYFFD